MPDAPRLVVPSEMNCLTEVVHQDGSPTSAHVGRELIKNDRWLHARLRRCISNTAWPYMEPVTLLSVGRSYALPEINHTLTPGVRQMQTLVRANIESGHYLRMWISTSASRAFPRVRNPRTWWLKGDGTEKTYSIAIQGPSPDIGISKTIVTDLLGVGGANEVIRFYFQMGPNPDVQEARVNDFTISDIPLAEQITVQNNDLAAYAENPLGYTCNVYDAGINEYLLPERMPVLRTDQDKNLWVAPPGIPARLRQHRDSKSYWRLHVWKSRTASLYNLASYELPLSEIP